MRRLFIPLAAAAIVAACSDVPSAPASLRPGPAHLSREGDPPPPPVSGDGSADFDAFVGDNSETACTAHDSFNFSYQYLKNSNTNTYLHITVEGRGLDVAVHETENKLTAKGTLNGPGFTFKIDDAVGGTLSDKVSRVPPRVTIQLTGTLTTSEGETCTASAVLRAQLVDVDIDEIVVTAEPPPSH
jgi:hypothetical protein